MLPLTILLTTEGNAGDVPTAEEIAAAVWEHETRSLSTAAGGAVGPLAAKATAEIYATVFRGGTVPLSARVFLANGIDAKIADIASIHYTIFDGACESHSVGDFAAIELAPRDILSDRLLSDALASAYNFRHTPDVSLHSAFPDGGRTYVVEYRLIPTSGQPIIVRFRVRCL